jgi:predicted RNA-binding protein with EMAP domain
VHGDTAIVFVGEHDLNDRIDEALAMPPAARQEMRARVLEYYDSYLTPKAVVSRMLAPQVRTIRLLAEEDSVELFRRVSRTATDERLPNDIRTGH